MVISVSHTVISNSRHSQNNSKWAHKAHFLFKVTIVLAIVKLVQVSICASFLLQSSNFNKMKYSIFKTTLIVILSAISLSAFAQNTVSLSTFQSDLQGILDNATSNYGMDGAEASVIIDDSLGAFTFYSGLRAPGVPVDTLKPWHIGQVAATYTTYIALKLIEEGSLNMDDSIAMHMDANAMGLDGDITVRQLIRHNSVLNEFWNTSNPNLGCFGNIWNSSQLGCPGDLLSCLPPAKASPTGFDLNNTNTLVLQFLIDSITGNSFETEIENRIFDLFDMPSNTYMSSCKLLTIDSINGIWTTNSGYANNVDYTRYFSTNGGNRGLISSTEPVSQFYRALFQDKLFPSVTMDSIKKIIPGSAIPQGSYGCAANITGYSGYNIEIVEIITNAGDTAWLFGKGGLGMNGFLGVHWPEKDITITFVHNDRSRPIQQRNLAMDFFCYLNTIDSIILPVIPIPEAGFTFTSNNLDFNFTDTTTNNPDSWIWDFGDGNTSTQQNPQHSFANGGIYDVTLIASNSSGSDTTTVQISAIGVSLNEQFKEQIAIYPNPARDVISIELAKLQNIEMQLISLQGMRMDKAHITNESAGRFQYQIPLEIENGIYLIRLEGQNTSAVFRIQIQK